MKRKDYKVRNTMIFHDYYARLREIALSVFKWEGLPDTCNARFLEKCLFDYGIAIFVNDEDMSFLNLKATASDVLNVYNEPIRYTAFSTGYSKEYKAEECVIVRNNILEKSTDSTILLYAERLAILEIAIQVNINAQKTPILIKCDEKTRKSLEVLYEYYDGGKPVIFGTKALENPIECIVTGAPFVADKLREEKRAVWNEALEFLGINTNPSDKKKERLIVNEVDANNEQIDIQNETMLLTREEACERLNALWGLNVTVSKRLENEVDAKGVEQWQNTPLN